MKTLFNNLSGRFLTPTAQAIQHTRPVLLGALALLGTALARPVRAQQPQPVQLSQPDASSLRLRFDNPTGRPARLTVLDLSRDYYLLNEAHREPAYGTRLNFDTLPTGRYLVALRIGPAHYRYTVQVETKVPGTTTIAVLNTTTHRVESGLAVR